MARRRKSPLAVAQATTPEVVRFPLGGRVRIPIPKLSVLLGACIVPAPGAEGSLLTDGASPAARRAWEGIRRSGVAVLVDGEDFLVADRAESVVAEVGAPLAFRSSDVDPFVVTPRDGGIEVESFVAVGRRPKKAPAGWEVWVYVAR